MTNINNSSLKTAIKAGYELREECEQTKLSAQNYDDTVLMDRLTEAACGLSNFSEALGDLISPYERAKAVLKKAQKLYQELENLDIMTWEPADVAAFKDALWTLEDCISNLEDAAGR